MLTRSFASIRSLPIGRYTSLSKRLKLLGPTRFSSSSSVSTPLPQAPLTNAKPKPATSAGDLANRDHRAIAKAQQLFMIHPSSPGSVFMLPHGTRIVQRLQDFIRGEYHRFGYEEVMTPLIYKKDLWETSGHWQNYKENMFLVHGGDGHENDLDKDGFGLKPMNCPGHCLIFDNVPRSYRDLPLRYADFSPLHRNEATGALTGLTRVRRFHQDDAHIFCTESQIQQEVRDCLTLIDRIYSIFRFPRYELTLSTRPDAYMGELREWDHAEAALRSALDSTGKPWSIKEGDGAFYGPKIDVMVGDALGRTHQTATVQLDFQLPARFGLRYQDEQDKLRTPIIIHRAVLGSVERMLAILIEHTEGKWPFWLSPRQAVVIPVGPSFEEYARKVAKALSLGQRSLDFRPEEANTSQRYYVNVDASARHSLGKMIREAQLLRYNFIMVVGQKEQEAGLVNLRTRDGKQLGTKSLEEILDVWAQLESNYE
ncbi:uncharacterized protein VTP21DRAFT_7314 [Calcarisporiella thermophila]|uniref:uncharacterized protein n=1 Tax=Calcarisporiella thermophila TaxID=911321 RepID=UPI003742A074